MTTEATDEYKPIIEALRATLRDENYQTTMTQDLFLHTMLRRRKLARYITAVPKLAFDQGKGKHRQDIYPIWAEPREVDLYATDVIMLGSSACAVVDFKHKQQSSKWVDTALVLIDNPSSDVFDADRRLVTSSGGDLYLPNYQTPNTDQMEQINFIFRAVFAQLDVILPTTIVH